MMKTKEEIMQLIIERDELVSDWDFISLIANEEENELAIADFTVRQLL